MKRKMSAPQPYKLMIKTLTKSKSRFLKFIPMKSFVEGEPYEISFNLENIGEEVFPGGVLDFKITSPSKQEVRHHFPIPPLSRNESYPTSKYLTDALSDGYGLVYISMEDVHREQGKVRQVEFYSGKRVEDRIYIQASISTIKSRSWEEIYEFWALIVATISLAIIALDKMIAMLIEAIKI